MVLLSGVFEAGVLRAGGIALSTDGVTWLAGTGGFGGGWGDVGRGISVEAGATFYLKYYSENRASSLYFAVHGTKWGSWQYLGPQLAPGIGDGTSGAVILKFQDAGTPKGTVTWMNGSGTWAGLRSPGVYDFALSREAMWTLPPVTIRPPQKASWWRALGRAFNSTDPVAAGTNATAVPDSGGTIILLGIALVCLAIAWRIHRRRRRARSGRGATET